MERMRGITAAGAGVFHPRTPGGYFETGEREAMRKLIAVLNVIAWSGFWAFGYLALTAGPAETGQVLVALVLAALGGLAGIVLYLRLARMAEDTGYARGHLRAVPEQYRDGGEAG